MFRRRRITEEENSLSKEILFEMVSMLVGLVKSNSDRVYDDAENYNIDHK
jgi:hypothetical protein